MLLSPPTAPSAVGVWGWAPGNCCFNSHCASAFSHILVSGLGTAAPTGGCHSAGHTLVTAPITTSLTAHAAASDRPLLQPATSLSLPLSQPITACHSLSQSVTASSELTHHATVSATSSVTPLTASSELTTMSYPCHFPPLTISVTVPVTALFHCLCQAGHSLCQTSLSQLPQS